MLRQLEIDLTQHCTFTKGTGHELCLWSELIGGIMSSPNLQKRTALFKDLCSKLLASWCNDFAQCIAAVKGLRLQADYRAVQMYNLEVLTVAPSPPPLLYGNLHQLAHAARLPHAKRPAGKLYRCSRTGLAGLWLPLAFAPYARLAQSRG